MGLIAFANNKDKICSLDFEGGHEIRCKYPLGTLTCPFCGQVVHAVDKPDYVLYFRHNNNECTATIGRHPESREHRLGKQFLAEKLREECPSGCSIEIEFPVLKAGKNGRVADVAAVYPCGYLYIYECQLAPITTNELEQRTYDYRTVGGVTVWFFGQKSANQAVTDWAIAHQGFCDVFDFTIVETLQN